MRTTRLLQRSLAYYWQTNLVVVLGVATAVAVLTGALLIGDSVRGSLRDLVSQRLGRTDILVSSANFFGEQLAGDLTQPSVSTTNGIRGVCPLIALDGVVTHESSRRRAGDIRVYGVDERFWQFNGVVAAAPQNRQVFVSQSLASELGANSGDSLLLRIEKPSDIPVESLHGRKDDPGRTIRVNLSSVLPANQLGEFSLRPQQGPVRAIFVSLAFLQSELGQAGKVNTILISGANSKDKIETLLRERTTLGDVGLTLRRLSDANVLSLESNSNIISDAVANAAQQAAADLSLKTTPVLSYLANSITAGDRSVPYSLVSAVDDASFLKVGHQGRGVIDMYTGLPAIVINDWTARELNVDLEDKVTLDYYVWQEGGRLETRKADFSVGGITPITGLAADRELVPAYPGITESENISDWDPPFPIDLNRVRKQDEDYWHKYRTTPKAFIPMSEAQKLWQTRFGKLTSIRIQAPGGGHVPFEVQDEYYNHLVAALPPGATGFQVAGVRDQGVQASRGATDFGEYFLYFSFFLVISALLLTALFFKLGIEQRLREIGTLQALGFSDARIRRLFLAEGFLLAIVGSLLGALGAIGYAKLLMYGLKTWWVDAVGTTALTLHVSWTSLAIGAAGGIVAALVCILLTLRKLGASSTRGLLLGDSPKGTRIFRIGIGATVVGLALLIGGAMHWIPQVAGFFGGGVVLLIAGVCFLAAWLRSKKRASIHGAGWWGVALLGFRNASYRPSRTVLCVTLIASAAFIIVAVDAFRRSGATAEDKKSGSGGYALFAESLLPIVYDANTPAGREALNLNSADVKFVNFRVRPGDDTSCLNLYQPRNPKIIAPPDSFVQENRFTFQSSIDPNQQNPWQLLNTEFPDGAIPVIADANSLTYVLHLKLGQDLVIDHSPQPLHLRIVGALVDSIFQSELLMSEKNFVRLFPEEQGYRFFLLDTPAANSAAVAATLEDRLTDFGFDAQSTSDRLGNFHRVENTYLSTFQLLGGLGLILGTLGMAAVLLRNVFERRRELALLRAVGYNSSHFAVMVITENVLMLCCGVGLGFVCALLAIAPVFFERGGRLPNVSLGLLLLAVLVSGALASLVATLAALRSPLLPALRAE